MINSKLTILDALGLFNNCVIREANCTMLLLGKKVCRRCRKTVKKTDILRQSLYHLIIHIEKALSNRFLIYSFKKTPKKTQQQYILQGD